MTVIAICVLSNKSNQLIITLQKKKEEVETAIVTWAKFNQNIKKLLLKLECLHKTCGTNDARAMIQFNKSDKKVKLLNSIRS